MIKFSIIVPVFNVEKYIHRCVTSILNQSISDFELILIDDGSTDKSGAICAEYAKLDERIIFVHQDNKGVSSARNNGLKIAKGEYIIFVDSDDWVEKEMLETANRYNEDLILFGRSIREKGNQILSQDYNEEKLFSDISKDTIYSLFVDGKLNYCYAKVFKSKIIQENELRFNETLKFSEDTLFVLQYISKCNTLRINSYIAYQYIRYGENTLSSGKYDIQFIDTLETANLLIEKELSVISNENSKVIMKKRMGTAYHSIIFNMINNNEYSYDLLKYMFCQNYFRQSLEDIDEIYKIEGDVFCTVLKYKSPFILFLYLKFTKLLKELRRK